MSKYFTIIEIETKQNKIIKLVLLNILFRFVIVLCYEYMQNMSQTSFSENQYKYCQQMSQYYSYLIFKELKRLFPNESNEEVFSSGFGSFWVPYYSFSSMQYFDYRIIIHSGDDNYDEYLNSLVLSRGLFEQQSARERDYLESGTISSHYFEHPPHIELAVRFHAWKVSGHYLQYASSVEGYNHSLLECSILDCCSEHVLSLLREDKVKEVLFVLGEHGIYHLLGLRHTVGSIFMLYPPKHLLLAQFQIPNNPKSKLTVGARALSKHCIRCKQNWVKQAIHSELHSV